MTGSPEHDPMHSAEAELHIEKLRQLEAGPGLVTRPVGDKIMSAHEALRHESILPLRHLGNFSLYFSRPESIAGVYLSVPCRQRFAIIYPTLTTELEEFVRNPSFHVTNADIGADARLVQAYDLMRDLVDGADTGVSADGHSVNALYLLQ